MNLIEALAGSGVITLFLVLTFCGCFKEAKANPGLQSFAYVLQADRFAASRTEAISRLADCGRDLLVLDASFNGEPEERWQTHELYSLRAAHPGRKVIAYLSIGEAEDYRSYWQAGWIDKKESQLSPLAPDWLCPENPAWKGNYKVRYWDPEWQGIILEELNRLITQGFDGVWLDIVDGFEFFEEQDGDFIDNLPNPQTGQTFRQDMIDWVKRISTEGKKKRQGFLIIAQNGSQLLNDPSYRAGIDALALEDLFSDGKRRRAAKESSYIQNALTPFQAEGKPVFLTEYAREEPLKAWIRQRARESSIRLLLTDRDLTTLGESHP